MSLRIPWSFWYFVNILLFPAQNVLCRCYSQIEIFRLRDFPIKDIVIIFEQCLNSGFLYILHIDMIQNGHHILNNQLLKTIEFLQNFKMIVISLKNAEFAKKSKMTMISLNLLSVFQNSNSSNLKIVNF